MSFVRLHASPKICRKPIELWGAKELYLNEKSRLRYLETDDGKVISEMVANMKPEIGRIESVRFIDNN